MVRTSLCVLLFLSVSIARGTEPLYEVIDLGTLGGNVSRSWFGSVNDKGHIVGGASLSPYNSSLNACLYGMGEQSHNINLGTLGGLESEAITVNNNGQIVGYAQNSIGYYRACLFDPTGQGNNINLGAPLGGDSYAVSINDFGQIVGHNVERGLRATAYLFDPTGNGNNILLAHNSWAYSINNNGQAVGQIDGHAGIFDITGQGNNINIGAPDELFSTAYDINNSGQIVGEIWDSSRNHRACIFDPTGRGNNIILGTLGGHSYAYAISDMGQTVGASKVTESGDYRACLFDPTGKGNNIDLNTLIDPTSGWTLQYAYDINNNGWIVGEGINPDGEYHAFLLVPEPASLMLLAFGGFLLRKQRITN